MPILNPRRLLNNTSGAGPTAVRHPVRVGVRPKAARRKWNVSHVVATVAVFGVIAAFVYVFITPDFYIYNADIQSARYTPADQIYQQAAINGFSAFFIDPAQVAGRLEQLPHVRHAVVRLNLPNRVQILVEEREPTLLYQVANDVKWVDDDGVMAPVVADQKGLPRLIDDAAAARRDERHLDPALLQAIRQIATNVPQVNTFRYEAPYGLFFISPEGWRVYLGNADDMANKLATWEAIRPQLLKQKARVQEVDLRYHTPYWR